MGMRTKMTRGGQSTAWRVTKSHEKVYDTCLYQNSQTRRGCGVTLKRRPGERAGQARTCTMGCSSDDDGKKGRLGPEALENRHCTDIPFAILFGLFVVGMAWACGWGVENGEPERLLHGHDSYGNICGQKNDKRITNPNSGIDMTNFEHSYYTLDPEVGYRQLCVAACPTAYTTDTATIQSLGLCLGVGNSPYAANNNPNASSEATQSCPAFAYNAFETGVTNRCFPSANSTLTAEATAQFNGASEATQAMADVYDSLEIIATMCILAMISVFAFIALMRCCAGPIVWTAVVTCFIALCCAFVAFSYATADARRDLDKQPEEEQTKAEQANVALLISGTVFFALVLLLYTCIVVAMRKRISQAVKIFEMAAEALFEMPTTFCCPFITAFWMIMWMIACIAIILYVVTANSYSTKDGTGYIEYGFTEEQKTLLWYMVFAIFWGTQLLLAMLEFTIASNTAIWYLHSGDAPGWPLKKSIWRIFRYNFGSLALGSLIVAIVQMVRAVVEFLEHQYNQGQEHGGLRKWIFSCIKCLLACIEKCVKFINKNAYIQIAIWGESFCPSACAVFSLLGKHLSLIAIVNGVAYLIVFIIKLGIVVAMAFLTYLWVRTKQEIEFYALIIVIVILLSFVLVDAFTDVYEVCAEAIMICYLEDHDKNAPGPFLFPEKFKKHGELGTQELGTDKDGKKAVVNPSATQSEL